MTAVKGSMQPNTAVVVELWGVIRSGFLRVGENEAKSVCL